MKKYITDFCSGCKKETWHRQFRRYGHRGGGDSKHYLKRTVTYCLTCQKRKIVNTTPHKKERHIRLR